MFKKKISKQISEKFLPLEVKNIFCLRTIFKTLETFQLELESFLKSYSCILHMVLELFPLCYFLLTEIMELNCFPANNITGEIPILLMFIHLYK